MIQNDAIKTVADAWKGSTLSTFDGGATGFIWPETNGSTAILLIATAFFGIVMFKQIALCVGTSFVAIFNPIRQKDIYGSTTFGSRMFLSTALLLPLFSYVLFASGLSNIDFLLTMAVVAALIALRHLQFNILNAIIMDECLQDVRKSSDYATVIFMTLALPLYFISLFCGEKDLGFYRIYLLIIGIISALPYLYFATRKIISSRFSLFFTFLYLCALEILPIAVAVKVLID